MKNGTCLWKIAKDCGDVCSTVSLVNDGRKIEVDGDLQLFLKNVPLKISPLLFAGTVTGRMKIVESDLCDRTDAGPLAEFPQFFLPLVGFDFMNVERMDAYRRRDDIKSLSQFQVGNGIFEITSDRDDSAEISFAGAGDHFIEVFAESG
jgi:hypothetical protein